MVREKQIAKIIEKRLPLAHKIEDIKKNLFSLFDQVNALEESRKQLSQKIDDPGVTGQLREIDLFSIQQVISSEIESLTKLKARFSRSTLNIGVIGRARQGKSRLLQSLTGLTKAEIPDGSGQHCTGVRSTIRHNADVETYGQVSFYTERTFLDEVIAPYYEDLKLGISPRTLDEFANMELPSLPKGSGAEASAKYEHLRSKYCANIHKYSSLLKEASPKVIGKDQIREYVAQDNLEGERIYFNYLAVKEVEIVCSFPKQDVGKIALVDLPGLGDTGIGDEKRMVQTIGQDIDAVLFVRMPKQTGDYWADVDVQLYDTAYQALSDLPLSLWSFMVLNRLSDGSNCKLCDDLKDDISNKHINVVNCFVANCADEREANEEVLDPVLSHLAKNIALLDQQYASSCQERLLQLQSKILVELDKAKKALGAVRGANEFEKFSRLFSTLWEELTYGLDEFLRDLDRQTEQRDQDFMESIEEVVKRSREDAKIPASLEEIKKRMSSEGGSSENAYNLYLNEVRTNLSQHFLFLDKGLKNSLMKLKNQIVQILLEKGLLEGLTEKKSVEFLEEIIDRLENFEYRHPDQPSRLKYGFQILSDFELSYRGMIQHRIRKNLDILTPDKTYLKLSTTSASQEPAQQIKSSLQVLHREALFNCRKALEELLCEPSQAKFAIVEEFIDRVLRAEKVKEEWEFFLYEERASIWPTEFEQLGERSKLRQEWQSRIESVEAMSRADYFQLVNVELG